MPDNDDSESSFFVSYSRQDSAYVGRLKDLLHDAKLPVWSDTDLGWGDRYVAETRRRIGGALAVIVVMTPAAEKSDWVEREILEGQRHNRLFLPILLAGDRFFLLASSNYFDARDGGLPGDREMLRLRRLFDATAAGVPETVAQAPLALVEPAAGRAPATVDVPVDVSLSKLYALLSDGQFAFADILTTSLVLQATGRLERGWIGRADAVRLRPGLLASIDSAWSKASAGRYGFAAQLLLHPAAPPGAPAGRHRDFFALSLAVGWKNSRRDTAPRYVEFIETALAPPGFFPTLRNPQLESREGWHDRWLETVMAVHVQLRRWKDQH